jgi:hypothetical protein
MYRELRALESALRTTTDPARRTELHAQLEDLDARAARVRVSDAFAAPTYELKQNIRFVLERYG